MAEDDRVTQLQKRVERDLDDSRRNTQDSTLNALRVHNMELRNSQNKDEVHKKALHPYSLTEANKLREAEIFLGDKPSGGLPYNIEVPGRGSLGSQGLDHPELQQEVLRALENRSKYLKGDNTFPYPGRQSKSSASGGSGSSGGQGRGGMKEDKMGSGSREYDFNTMADMGRQVSENKKALDDVRSSFVGPTQEEDAPEPTPVVLDGPATEEGDDNKVNLNELAYAAKRHLEEVGHPAADMLMTPANIKKLAEFENKRQRVERERLAYEEDPEGYDLNSANALDAYVKSWNLKNLTPEQRTGSSAGPAAEATAASAEAIAKEVPRMAPDRGNGMSVDGGSSSGGEAPAPRRQSASSSERHTPAGKVSKSKPPAVAPTKGPSKTNNGITTGPNPPATTRPLSREANEIRAKAKVSARELNNLSPEERTEFNQTGISPLNGEEWDQAAYNGPVKSAEEMRQILASRKQLEKEGQVGSPEFIASIVPPLLGAAGMYGMSKAGPKINKAGQRLGAGIETVKAMTNRPASKPAVNNNISRVAKPPGLQEGFTPTRPAAKAAPTPRIPPSQEPSGSSRVSGRSKPKPPAQQAREMRDDKTPSTSKAKLAKVEKELKTPKKPKKG